MFQFIREGYCEVAINWLLDCRGLQQRKICGLGFGVASLVLGHCGVVEAQKTVSSLT